MIEKHQESSIRRGNQVQVVLGTALFEEHGESTSMLRKEGREVLVPHLLVEIRCLVTLTGPILSLMVFLVVLVSEGEKVINTIIGTQESAMSVILLWITIKPLIVNTESILM